MGIVVNGKVYSAHEASELIRMFINDAKQLAGRFHNMERSEKYRTNWGNEYEAAELNFKNFIEATRVEYAKLMGRSDVSEHDKERMAAAIMIYDKAVHGQEQFPGVQIEKDSQQFWGDKYENAKIVEKFSKAPNLRAWLKRSTPLARWTQEAETKTRH